MNPARGATAIFYLVVGVSFIALLLAAPYPHYSTKSKNWYLGVSLGSRIMGSKDPSGVPADKLVAIVTNTAITSPLEIACGTDTDCKEYTVVNQCAVYCGNLSEANTTATTQLNNQRVCDPKMWKKPFLNCRCVAGKCISLK